MLQFCPNIGIPLIPVDHLPAFHFEFEMFLTISLWFHPSFIAVSRIYNQVRMGQVVSQKPTAEMYEQEVVVEEDLSVTQEVKDEW